MGPVCLGVPVGSARIFEFIQLKDRRCVDVIEEMTGMHEEEEDLDTKV